MFDVLTVLGLACVALLCFMCLKSYRRSHFLYCALLTIKYQSKDTDSVNFAKEVIDFVDTDTKNWKIGLNPTESLTTMKESACKL